MTWLQPDTAPADDAEYRERRVAAKNGSDKLLRAILGMPAAPKTKPRKVPAYKWGGWWTKADVRRLRELAEIGLGSDEIAKVIGRTRCAVRAKAFKSGISIGKSKSQRSAKPENISEWSEADHLSELADVPDRLAEIVVGIGKSHKLSYHSLRGRGRMPDVVRCRKEICTVARSMGFSLMAIGRAINRDHTTVIHAIATYSSPFSTGQELVSWPSDG